MTPDRIVIIGYSLGCGTACQVAKHAKNKLDKDSLDDEEALPEVFLDRGFGSIRQQIIGALLGPSKNPWGFFSPVGVWKSMRYDLQAGEQVFSRIKQACLA